MTKEVYNTVYGIESALSSYDSFKTMINKRHSAYYVEKKCLEEFILFGAIYLDTCGNVWHLDEKVRAPKVLTLEDFKEIKEHVSCYLWNMPPSSINCFYCGKGWSIESQDFLKHHTFETGQEITNQFIGKSLSEINVILSHKTDGKYYIPLNESENSTIVEKDEKLFCHIRRYLHEECMEQYIRLETNQIFENKKLYDRFKNLAGDKFCDLYIETELKIADIPIQTVDKTRSEVPFTKIGFIEQGPFTFERAWCYWVVHGPVPLDIAKDLYADPVGVKDIRFLGHCGCPPPEQYANEINRKQFVSTYHIDSLSGLKLFVEKIKKS